MFVNDGEGEPEEGDGRHLAAGQCLDKERREGQGQQECRIPVGDARRTELPEHGKQSDEIQRE